MKIYPFGAPYLTVSKNIQIWDGMNCFHHDGFRDIFASSEPPQFIYLAFLWANLVYRLCQTPKYTAWLYFFLNLPSSDLVEEPSFSIIIKSNNSMENLRMLGRFSGIDRLMGNGYYRPQSRGDDTSGSVSLSICPSVRLSFHLSVRLPGN